MCEMVVTALEPASPVCLLLASRGHLRRAHLGQKTAAVGEGERGNCLLKTVPSPHYWYSSEVMAVQAPRLICQLQYHILASLLLAWKDSSACSSGNTVSNSSSGAAGCSNV